MPIDMRRPLIAAIQAALDEVQAEPQKKKRHGVGAGRAVLLGAGIYTAGRVVARGRGRGLVEALEQRLPHQQDGSDEDEQYDEEPEDDEDVDEDEEPEDDEDVDDEPEAEAGEEPETEGEEDEPESEPDEEEPAPEAEGDEEQPEDDAPDGAGEEPEDEPEEEAPKPRRGSRGRATRSRR